MGHPEALFSNVNSCGRRGNILVLVFFITQYNFIQYELVLMYLGLWYVSNKFLIKPGFKDQVSIYFFSQFVLLFCTLYTVTFKLCAFVQQYVLNNHCISRMWSGDSPYPYPLFIFLPLYTMNLKFCTYVQQHVQQYVFHDLCISRMWSGVSPLTFISTPSSLCSLSFTLYSCSSTICL